MYWCFCVTSLHATAISPMWQGRMPKTPMQSIDMSETFIRKDKNPCFLKRQDNDGSELDHPTEMILALKSNCLE